MKKAIVVLGLLLNIPFLLTAQNAVSVQSSGSGEPIMFLPGFATPSEVWMESASQFPHHESLLVSYAGFGEVAPVEFPWFEKVKTGLIQYLISENLSNLTLVGHSMGGNLALAIAAELPERIAKVVIVDTLPCMREIMMPGVPAEALAYESPYNDQLLAMDQASQDAYLDQMSGGMVSDTGHQQILKNWMAKADRKTFVYGYVDLLKLDSRPLLAEIKTPVLILVADQPFGQVALENMTKQYELLKNKEIVLSANSKHYIMMDQQDWFIDQLKTFLAGE
ncbi:alpha/beta fold hydrolase [Algoriphagus namhaensis]